MCLIILNLDQVNTEWSNEYIIKSAFVPNLQGCMNVLFAKPYDKITFLDDVNKQLAQSIH